MQELNIKKENVVVVGDSITDIPMGKAAGMFIAFNDAKEELTDIADVVINKKDLKEILKYI